MFDLQKIEDIIKYSKLIKQEIVQYNKARDKGNCHPDLAQKGVYIHKLRHELHCLCVEFGIAQYEEELYGERVQHNGRNETLHNYRKPLI